MKKSYSDLSHIAGALAVMLSANFQLAAAERSLASLPPGAPPPLPPRVSVRPVAPHQGGDQDEAPAASNGWRLTGNAGTSAGANFVGTTDNQPLEVRVNRTRALRLEPTTNGAPNLVGGAGVNNVAPGTLGATIAGGGTPDLFGGRGAFPNRVSGDYGVIGGGIGNLEEAFNATIAGGDQNHIHPGCFESAVGGGSANEIAAPYGTIAGGVANIVGANAGASTIAGGYLNAIRSSADPASASSIGGGQLNAISGFASAIAGGNQSLILGNVDFVGGGEANLIESNVTWAAIGGGYHNTIRSGSWTATIAGGDHNLLQGDCAWATIGGGRQNLVAAQSVYATLGGGQNNSALASNTTVAGGGVNSAAAGYSTIGGGLGNTTAGAYATIPGGVFNTATGESSFAAGRRAKADYNGAFVWADSQDIDFGSSGPNQFAARCTGGVVFVTAIDDAGTPAAGVAVPAGSGSWSSLSDRNAKENLRPVDAEAILKCVAQMPIASWNYKTQDRSVRHVGPMAQDFYTAFSVGEDDRHIATVDADGVALAAIQGLNQKVEQENSRLEAESAELKAKNQSLERRIQHLEQLLNPRSR